VDVDKSAGEQQVSTLISALHKELLLLGFVSLSSLLPDLSQAADMLARKENKEVTVSLKDANVFLDIVTFDAIKDILLHLIRNAVHHGIELPAERVRQKKPSAGSICIELFCSGQTHHLVVRDDGKGIDLSLIRERAIDQHVIRASQTLSDQELLNLLFQPGFSTEESPNDIAGHGIGLDVVKKSLEEMLGTCALSSRLHQETCFNMNFTPPSLLQTCLLFRITVHIFALPLTAVYKVLSYADESIIVDPAMHTLTHEGTVYTLYELIPSYLANERIFDQNTKVLLLQSSDTIKSIACVIDEYSGIHQLITNPLPFPLAGLPHISALALSLEQRPVPLFSVPFISSKIE